MRQFLPALGVLLVVALTLLSGIIHGQMSRRWGLPEDLVAIGAKLQEIPESFGNWQLESSGELSDSEIKMLECAGYIVRTYVNQATGETVNMALIVGPSMPISLHRAEICWNSRGHTIRDQRQQVIVRDSDHLDQQFWALTFQTNDINKDLVRVYYGWSDGRRWSEHNERRLSLTHRPYLYKIEVVSRLRPGTTWQTSDPCRDFLQDFIPVAKPCLEPSGG